MQGRLGVYRVGFSFSEFRFTAAGLGLAFSFGVSTWETWHGILRNQTTVILHSLNTSFILIPEPTIPNTRSDVLKTKPIATPFT